LNTAETVKRSPRQFVAANVAAVCTLLAVLGSLTSGQAAFAARAAVPASVSGVVRDSTGAPQIGILVELLRADSTLAGRAFTDDKGIYRIASVLPGQYALKAVGNSFIPAMKQNLRIRTGTVVNLTLNTLYDLMQWAPQSPRQRPESEDDWAWTLRTAQSRPLLRWQDDGSPILITDGSQETATRRQRMVKAAVSGGGSRFGAGSEQVSLAMQTDLSARRRMAASSQLVASSDVAPVMDAMLGFRQEMVNSGMGSSSIQTLAAVMIDPAVNAGAEHGLQVASMRSWESMQLMNSLEAEAGSDQVLARAGSGSAVVAALPFARVVAHRGASALEYRVATARSASPSDGEAMAGAWLPIVSERDGRLTLEHGMHQELGWSTSAGPAEMRLVLFGDHIENPAIEASGKVNPNDEAQGWMLVDNASGLIRAAGPNYSTTGMLASVESRVAGHYRVKLSYAGGDALVMRASAKPEDVATILAGAHARRVQMYSVALSGTAEGLGTRWRASYRWQPDDTVTEVAPFAVDASEPYLNVYIRQPIHLVSMNRENPGNGLEAQLDLRNLLAEGYQPFLTSDGSHLYFAQAQRCIRGGLAFTF
jgi:Carboxypeptidase regulatory-like domain